MDRFSLPDAIRAAAFARVVGSLITRALPLAITARRSVITPLSLFRPFAVDIRATWSIEHAGAGGAGASRRLAPERPLVILERRLAQLDVPC